MSRVIHEDIRTLGYCNRGARVFFERHGINWQSFMEQGVDFETLEAIDDEMAREAILQAKLRIAARGEP